MWQLREQADAPTPWLAAEGPPDQSGPRPGPAARPTAPASGQGQRLGCGLRPPSDVWSSQHQIINGGRPYLLVGRVAPHSTTSQVTIYGWSTSLVGEQLLPSDQNSEGLIAAATLAVSSLRHGEGLEVLR